MNCEPPDNCAWKTKDIFFLLMRDRLRRLMRDGTDLDTVTKMFNIAIDEAPDFKGYPKITKADVQKYIETQEV